MEAADALLVDRLAVSYGPIRALHGLSFRVPRGALVALVGANGAGKTTTLRAVSGMVRYSGSVTFQGRSLAGLTPDRILARGLAHVPEGRHIFGSLTVLENLQLASWLHPGRSEIAAGLARVFELFPRLSERKHQIGGTLSGGEQQMLALGRALMSRASFLLLDEPSMGLAPVLVREIFNTLERIKQSGVGMLLVEQNVHMALRLADYAYVLETGHIAAEGSGAEIAARGAYTPLGG